MFPSPGIGDILAICHLIVKIGMIINDIATGNVPQEFSELKEELRVLYEVLQSIKNINDTSLSFDASIALQRIQREAKSCEDAMNEFLKKNSPPESKTRKAVWMIRVTKKAALLRGKLSVHRENLGIFWNEFRHQQQADCNMKQSDMLNQLLVLGTEHFATSSGQSNMLSQLLILGRDQVINSSSHTNALSHLQDMAIEQAASLNSWRNELQLLRPVIQGITLVDAVGSRMEIPFLFCRTYNLLSDVLVSIFKNDDRPGRSFVLRGDYNLVHGDAKNLISSSEWNSLLRPNLNVEMSMILRRNGAATDTCPRCRTSFHGDALGGWATCLKCGGQFQIKQQIREVEEISTPSIAALVQTTISSSHKRTSQTEELQQPEWALFRLLSVISTIHKLKPQDPQNKSVARLQEIVQTGNAGSPLRINHASSFSNPLTVEDFSSHQTVEIRRALQMVANVEGQLRMLQREAKAALSTHDISHLQPVREMLGVTSEIAKEERDKLQQSLFTYVSRWDTFERPKASLAQLRGETVLRMMQIIGDLDRLIQEISHETIALLAQQSLQQNQASNTFTQIDVSGIS